MLGRMDCFVGWWSELARIDISGQPSRNGRSTIFFPSPYFLSHPVSRIPIGSIPGPRFAPAHTGTCTEGGSAFSVFFAVKNNLSI